MLFIYRLFHHPHFWGSQPFLRVAKVIRYAACICVGSNRKLSIKRDSMSQFSVGCEKILYCWRLDWGGTWHKVGCCTVLVKITVWLDHFSLILSVACVLCNIFNENPYSLCLRLVTADGNILKRYLLLRKVLAFIPSLCLWRTENWWIYVHINPYPRVKSTEQSACVIYFAAVMCMSLLGATH